MAKNFNPKYKINMLDVFSRAYAGEGKELRSLLRPALSDTSFKVLYANLVIDQIVDNTQKNLDKHGNSMGTYSESYRNSLAFKIWKGNKRLVDLTQTGNMLSDVNPTLRKFQIVFGFNDQLNRNKAQGHITGIYGKHGKTDPRDFFGLPPKQEEKKMREAIRIYRNTGLSFAVGSFGV